MEREELIEFLQKEIENETHKPYLAALKDSLDIVDETEDCNDVYWLIFCKLNEAVRNMCKAIDIETSRYYYDSSIVYQQVIEKVI